MEQETELWQLGYMIAGATESDERAGPGVVGVGRIAIDEVEADNRAVHYYQASAQLFQSVWMNMQDFLEAFAQTARFFAEQRALTPEELDAVRLRFARLFMNILSMFRSFLDHTDASLSRRFGQDSHEWKRWKDALSAEYDAALSYRLFYKLRNYVQHVGVVPLGLEFLAKAEDDAIVIRLDVIPERLLAEKGLWGAKVAQDLANAPPRLALIELLDEWSKCIKRIVAVLIEIEQSAARTAAERILARRAAFDVPESATRLCALRVRPDLSASDGAVDFTMVGINERWARRVVDGSL